MSALARRGFTMIELLIALVILGIVSAALYKVLVTNQRTYLAQTQRSCARSTRSRPRAPTTAT